MEPIVRTIYGARLQTALMRQIPLVIESFTTLNEKLGILAGTVGAPGTYPKVGYVAIGNGGHSLTVGSDGIPRMKNLQHEAFDPVLFRQLPFVLRQLEDDIQPAERARYALRKEIDIEGVTYIAYYLRRIPSDEASISCKLKRMVNGVRTSSPFIPTADNLTPSPVVASNSGVNVLTADYITCESPMSVSFSAADVEELLKAVEIIHGDRDAAIISEMALCSGIDKTISVSSTSGPFNFTDAIQVQVVTHIACGHLMMNASNGMEKILDVGSNSPLYRIGAI